MHDIRLIRENPDAFDAAMGRRGLASMAADILALDGRRRTHIQAAEAAQATRNRASREVGAARARGDAADFERLRALVADKKAEITALEEKAKVDDAALGELLMGLPNILRDDVPDGTDEADNIEINRWGTPRSFQFTPLEHFDIPAAKPGMDFELAAKLSGARFMVLSGAIVRLHRALAQFMLDTHVEKNGLFEMWMPVLVRESAMLGTGQLPKFAEDSYQTGDGWWLIPTAEVPLTNSVAGEILDEDTLPRRLTAHTQCFRSEAGSAGRDTSGILRQHQFEKVEMVSITHPKDSRVELDRMTRIAERLLETLLLPYRTIVLCSGDTGFGATRTHDIEVWLPGQNMYREISSVSVCDDFQARRMNARFRPKGGGKPEFVHTLNGSALAVGRCLIAVLENGQQEDGSVWIPPALHPYLGGKTVITREGALA